MRSLWRILALQWLGGEGSEALAGDSATLEGLPHPADLRYRDDRGDRLHLRFSGDAVGGRIATSPWRVMSVRQSGSPAPPFREDEVIEPARTNPRR